MLVLWLHWTVISKRKVNILAFLTWKLDEIVFDTFFFVCFYKGPYLLLPAARYFDLVTLESVYKSENKWMIPEVETRTLQLNINIERNNLVIVPTPNILFDRTLQSTKLELDKPDWFVFIYLKLKLEWNREISMKREIFC